MPLYPEPRPLPAGDRALTVEVADEILGQANARVLVLERLLAEAGFRGVVETVPTYRSLLVHYDPLVLPTDTLVERLRGLFPRLAGATTPPGRQVELPCAYGGRYGFELEDAARRLDLSPDEVVRLHAGAEHLVYFIGFTPGLPYMAGMPERLTIPRLARPRTKTPPGSVAIGGTQCSIYPVDSPGGFWVLGRTPVLLYDPGREDLLLRPGDRIRFRPISADEFPVLAEAAAAGRYRPPVVPPGAPA
jgi:inhibitor of KinA